MFNLFLTAFNFFFGTYRANPDNIPDGYAGGIEVDKDSFILGIILGVLATLIVVGIIKFIIFYIKSNKEEKKK